MPASAQHHDWALAPALACWGMQLLLVSFARSAILKLQRWWSVACSPAAPAGASDALRLGVQVVALMMSSNWNVKDVTTNYWSNPARFRDLIRGIKQRADLGWSWAVQMVIEISTMSSIWNVEDMNAKYSSNPAKLRNLIREIKQSADLGWSWAVQMVIGTSRSDWSNEDVIANNSSTLAKFKY